MACRVPLNTLEPGLPGRPAPIVQNSTGISDFSPNPSYKIKKSPGETRGFVLKFLGKKRAPSVISENAQLF
jgi:hypothetical protein